MEMKKMVYGARSKNCNILYKGDYKEHKFTIINLGTHPCAYVENKLDVTDYYDDKLSDVQVHGGFTYCGRCYWNYIATEELYLGWDYAHSSDFTATGIFCTEGKQWTTEEIYDEVQRVIDQLIELEHKEADVVNNFADKLRKVLKKYECRCNADGTLFYQMNAESFNDEIDDIVKTIKREVKK